MGIFSSVKNVASGFASAVSGGLTDLAGITSGDSKWSGLFNIATEVGKTYLSRNWAENDATNQWNRDLAMFNLTNTYNSPSMQMQRLKAAGLNPNLVYGSGSVVGNTASSPSAPSVRKSADLNLLGSVLANQQIKMNDANYDNIRTEQLVRESAFLNNLVEARIRYHNLKIAEARGMPVGANNSPISIWSDFARMVDNYGNKGRAQTSKDGSYTTMYYDNPKDAVDNGGYLF